MNAQERYESWLNSPDVDEGTKAELRAIAGDPVEIEDRFYQEEVLEIVREFMERNLKREE